MLQEKALRENRIQENVLPVRRPVIAPRILPDLAQKVHVTEMLRVLDRAAKDDGVIAQLTYSGEQALQAYNLTWQEKAALLSGDIAWIEAHLGKLDARLRTWLDCRLQQEAW
jgi:hypothetical protein